MAGDPLRSKRKVMTGVIFSASNCHNQRPHYFIRHFGSYHEEMNMRDNVTNNAGNCSQEVFIMDICEYFDFIMVVLVREIRFVCYIPLTLFTHALNRLDSVQTSNVLGMDVSGSSR